MRICRFQHEQAEAVGFYDEQHVVPLHAAARAYAAATHEKSGVEPATSLLDCLPGGPAAESARRIFDWLQREGAEQRARLGQPTASTTLLVPQPRPNKLFLLAGNYARHIEEGGGVAAERRDTFPYVFMKPPTTTLTDPGRAIKIPAVSPQHVDWELELAVLIGRQAKGVPEADALSYVAGYTVINDISDRQFRPNPGRKERDKDSFFDWLHGKWHDSFCPCGPCVTSADDISDPQTLALQLRVNGELRQDSSSSHQIFPVAAVIEFISSFVTLEPGDLISTGTPAGVGNTTRTYLKPGDRLEAHIERIGTLVSLVD